MIKNTGIALAGAAVAEHGEWLYIYGGENALGIVDDFWRIHILTGAIESLGTDRPRSRHGIAVLGDTLYLFGGLDENGSVVDTLMTYDLNNIGGSDWKAELGASDTTGPFPSARYGHQVFAYDGALYIYGGTGNTSAGDTVLHRLSNFSDDKPKWENLNADGPALAGFGAAVSGDSLFAFGGFRYNDTAGIVYINDMWRYDFTTDRWSVIDLSTAPVPRAWIQLVMIKGTAYTFWGRDGSDTLEDSWSYCTAGQWKSIYGAPEPRALYAMASLGDELLIYGGYNSDTDVYYSDLWLLELD